MSAGLISLILNLVLILFVLIGFLAGVVRGAKKSGVRTGWLVGMVAVFFLISPLISGALTGVYIGPLNNTLGGFFEEKIAESTDLASLYADNAVLQELVEKLPALAINLVTVFLLTLVAVLFSYFGYLISKAIHFKKVKKGGDGKYYTVKNGRPVLITPKEIKPKKHRLVGGLIGALGGFVLCFCLFLPITGSVRTVMQYVDTGTTVAMAEEKQSTFAYPQVSNKIIELIGQENIGYLQAVQNSALVKIASVANLDLAVYDTISSVKIAGQKITLRSELRAVAEISETTFYVQSLTNEAGDLDWASLDFDKLNTSLDAMFGSGLLRGAGLDTIENLVKQASRGTLLADLVEKGTIDAQTAKYLKIFADEMQASINLNGGTLVNHFKSDLKAILGVAQAVCESGLIHTIMDLDQLNTVTLKEIQNCLKGQSMLSKVKNHDYLADISKHLFSSATLQAGLVGATNIGLDKLTDELTTFLEEDGQSVTGENAVKFDKVVQKNMNWNAISLAFDNLVDNALNLASMGVSVLDSEDFDAGLKQQLQNGNATEFAELLTDIMDELANLPLLSNTAGNHNILDQIFDTLGRYSTINRYADLSKIKNINWQTEMEPVKDILIVANPLLMTEIWQDYAFKTLNYDLFITNNTFGKLFGGKFAEALKLDAVKNKLNFQNSQKLAQILDTLFGNGATVKSANEQFSQFVDAIVYLAKAGGLELAMAEHKDAMNINMFVSGLLTAPNGQQNTYAQKALLELFTNDNFLQTYADLLNQFFEERAENYPQLGTVTAPTDLTAWKQNATENVVPALVELLRVYQSLDIATFEIFDNKDVKNIIFDTLLTADFAQENGNAQKLGQILDTLTNSLLLTTNFEGTAKNILREVMYINLADFAEILDREIILTTTNQHFWQNELTSIGGTLVTLDNTFADVTHTKTLLDVLFEEGATALQNCEGFTTLTSQQKQELLEPIFASQLLHPLATLLLQKIELAVGETFGGAFEGTIGDDVDLTGQVEVVVNVLENAQEIVDMFEENEEITLENVLEKTIEIDGEQVSGAEKITEILDTIQENQEGVFGEVYNTAFEYVQENYPDIPALADTDKNNVSWADVMAQIQAQLAGE